jgi:hypothetical protein
VSLIGALALAWAFDLSSVGPRREVSARSATDGLAHTTAMASLWQIPSFWIALALGAGLAVSAQQAWQRIVKPAFGERPGSVPSAASCLRDVLARRDASR